MNEKATRPLSGRSVAVPPGLSVEDRRHSATFYHLAPLDRCLGYMSKQRPPTTLIDLGCGIGTVTTYVAQRFGIDDPVGVEVDEDRLARLPERGITPVRADLNTEPLPFEDASFELAMSHGAFEHLTWYDNALSEAARVLAPGGWLLLSMPNLGSYVNRLALLLGYQPRDVEVSQKHAPGILPIYRTAPQLEHLGHPRSATLRCMRQLLPSFGFRILKVNGVSPYLTGLARVVDRAVASFPALSRRYMILAERVAD